MTKKRKLLTNFDYDDCNIVVAFLDEFIARQATPLGICTASNYTADTGYAANRSADRKSTSHEATTDIGCRNRGDYCGERSSSDEDGSEREHFKFLFLIQRMWCLKKSNEDELRGENAAWIVN